jgi:hypothetical protein
MFPLIKVLLLVLVVQVKVSLLGVSGREFQSEHPLALLPLVVEVVVVMP